MEKRSKSLFLSTPNDGHSGFEYEAVPLAQGFPVRGASRSRLLKPKNPWSHSHLLKAMPPKLVNGPLGRPPQVYPGACLLPQWLTVFFGQVNGLAPKNPNCFFFRVLLVS